tara:strand:+ start:2431 stop:2904 length:474 start_codon:yes stop_codon:yes gene_type:complete
MPTLVRNGEVTEDSWTYDVANANTPEAGSILNIEDFTKHHAGELHGVRLEGSVEIEDIIDQVKHAALIAISFSGFADGRGLSLAVLLRSRYDYLGELRAVGDVLPDWTPYMLRSGFDSFELPDLRAAETAIACMQRMTDHYQGSVSQPSPRFRRSSD